MSTTASFFSTGRRETVVEYRQSYAASDDDTKAALELIESSEIDVKQLITHTYSISDTQKAFDHAKTGDKAMKIIITK